MRTNERPIVTCIIAKPVFCGRGNVERSQIVPLSKALLAMKAGWCVVGPDPSDMERLAAWEREHAPEPFNGLRME